jgi:hypothetical protein
MTRCDHAAVLTRDLVMRVLEISASGCLIECRRRLDVGTVGRLRLTLGTDEAADDIEVVRCDAVEGARSTFHIGVRFLWTTPRGAGSIRDAVTRYGEAQDTAHQTWIM